MRTFASRPPAAVSPAWPQEPGLRAAVTSAGLGIVLLAALGAFGVLFAVDGLVTPGDAARTARDVLGSDLLFRLGIVSLLATATVDVVVAWGLYRLFQQTDAGVSMLAAWFRVAYATALVVAVGHLVGALRLLHAPASAYSVAQDQARALSDIDAFHDVFSAGLVLFGAHLMLVGHLARRSRFVPPLLAALVALAGAGYAFDGVASVLTHGVAPAVATVTFLGELLLGVWILARGRDLDGHVGTFDPVSGPRPGGGSKA